MAHRSLFTTLTGKWKKLGEKASSGRSAKGETWKEWTDALEAVASLPGWDGFLPLDCTPLGELDMLANFFSLQQSPYPAIAEYVEHRIHAAPFEHHPIDVHLNDMRLLKLDLKTPYLPGPAASCLLVELEIRHFNSAHLPEYYALSYVWGYPEYQMPILVNGKVLFVTQNLFCILSDLRRMNFEGWIWIDAICIDQKNELEKSLLVRRMASVYKHAERTLAWLGNQESRYESKPGVSLLCVARMKEIIDKKIRSFGIKLTDMKHWTVSPFTVNQMSSKDLMAFLSTNKDLVKEIMAELAEKREDGKANLAQFLEVLMHPIWTRIWIVQEFAYSGNVILASGEQSVKLEDFFGIWAVLYQYVNHDASFDTELLSSGIRTRIKSIAPMLMLSRLFEAYPNSRSLFELLRATSWFCASDPRDKIFALISLAEDASQLGLFADYGSSYESLCAVLSEAFLRKYGLSMLSFNVGCSHHHGQLDTRLPSWCSDWRLKTCYTILTDRSDHKDEFNACGTAKGASLVEFDRTRGRIILQATIVDAVSQVQKYELADFDSNTRQTTSRILAQLSGPPKDHGLTELAKTSNHLEDARFCVPIAYQRSARSTSILDANGRDKDLIESYKALCNYVLEPEALHIECHQTKRMSLYIQEVHRRVPGRAIFVCKNGYPGLGPDCTREGDLVCIFQDASVPHVIRPFRNDSFELLGEVYLHGVMYGEYFTKGKPFDKRTIVLE